MKDLKPIKNTGISAFEIEYPELSGEWHLFHIAHNKDVIAVGHVTNSGFHPEWWIEKDDTFSLDEQLEAVHEVITNALWNDEIDDLHGLIEL